MISPYAYGPLQRPGENDRTYAERYALYDRYDQFECDPPQYSPPGEYSETVQDQYNQCNYFYFNFFGGLVIGNEPECELVAIFDRWEKSDFTRKQ